MKYRLLIMPALEHGNDSMEIKFETAEQVVAAKNACADLLLFMQNKMKIMPDFSNSIDMEVFIDGDWEEYKEF